jgi:acetoin utilization protein AcuB
MLVKDYMTRHPLFGTPAMSTIEAQSFMGENGIRHLPIVGDGKRLLGLVTRQTLLVDPGRLGSLNIWEIARHLSDLKLQDVMIKAKDVVTIGPDVTIEHAAGTMVEARVGCLPVVEEDCIVMGMLSEVDLLAALTELLATHVPGVRVTVNQPNRKGELARLVAAIAAQGWGIVACGGVVDPKDSGRWNMVIKIRNVPKNEIVSALSQVEEQEIIDVRED